MALNPVETLNVFDKDLRTELRNRSFSKNLVRIRTPFLRFTTATDMSNIDNAGSLGPTFGAYKDCRFFTLGLHGWDNKNYSAADLYGTQSNKGLLIGTTYKQSDTGGEQRLMYTHTATSFRNVSLDTAAQNFPPPGITSASTARNANRTPTYLFILHPHIIDYRIRTFVSITSTTRWMFTINFSTYINPRSLWL